jgi:hypothetical protein
VISAENAKHKYKNTEHKVIKLKAEVEEEIERKQLEGRSWKRDLKGQKARRREGVSVCAYVCMYIYIYIYTYYIYVCVSVRVCVCVYIYIYIYIYIYMYMYMYIYIYIIIFIWG